MSTHKHIDRICAAAAACALLLTLLFMNGAALGIQPASSAVGYETRLFDTSRVHTVEIVMDGWDGFIETCENEEYAACSVVIDNEAYKNVGIRAKGNTSLSTVSQMGSDRYSFKIEFDQYESGKSYYGLDKLCLNNLIQDNAMMKDYLTYRLMGEFGVAAPLCSYVWITVNGEDWGLYLAVEGVEDAFLQRNYGQNHGQLYKPDSMSFGGGRGNGKGFDMNEFMDRDGEDQGENQNWGMKPSGDFSRPFGGDGETAPEGFSPPSSGGQAPGGENGAALPEGFDPSAFGGQNSGETPPEDFDPSGMFGGGFGGMFGGMGSGDVKLQYSDDSPDGYSNIFDSAKTDVTKADQTRLIQALKALGEGDADSALDMDQVLRYFVVHNFVVNGDSYTGMMVHNYYLYEEDGRLSMIPWDYNLAFGTFQGNDAAGAVNDPIDAPLSVSGDGDRPMADWIFSNEEYTGLYHQYFRQFLDSADCAALIQEAYALIAPYVERDPTKFCTEEEFQAGVEALKAFCELRVQSVKGQLSGAIPSTGEGQAADPGALVDASGLSLSVMGTMGMGGGPGGGKWAPGNASGGPEGEDGAPDGFPGSGGRPPEELGQPGGCPGGDGVPQGGGAPAGASGASLLLLGGSGLVLLAGLGTALRFRRRWEPSSRRRRQNAP